MRQVGLCHIRPLIRLLIRRLITGIPSSSSSCTKYGIVDHFSGMNFLRTSTGIAEMYASATTTEPSRICEISPRYIAEIEPRSCVKYDRDIADFGWRAEIARDAAEITRAAAEIARAASEIARDAAEIAPSGRRLGRHQQLVSARLAI